MATSGHYVKFPGNTSEVLPIQIGASGATATLGHCLYLPLLMPDTIRQQLLVALTAACATPSSTEAPSSTPLGGLLTALLEESLVQTHETSIAAWLDWQFAADAADSYSYELDAQAAGTYQLVGQTNCAAISVQVEERLVTLPFTVKVGERLTVTIQRTTPGNAAVQLLRIGVYRQLAAG